MCVTSIKAEAWDVNPSATSQTLQPWVKRVRKRLNKYRLLLTAARRSHFSLKMIWSCFAATGSGYHAVVESTVNSSVYQSIFALNMWLSTWKLKVGQNWFMEKDWMAEKKKKKKESRRCNGPIKVQMSTWLQSLTELCVKKFQQNSMSWSNVVKKFLHNATRDCSFIQKSITSKFLLERFFYKLLTHVFNKNAKTSQRLKQSICFGAIHLLSEISHFCSSAFKATPIWRKITSVWLLLTNRRFKH